PSLLSRLSYRHTCHAVCLSFLSPPSLFLFFFQLSGAPRDLPSFPTRRSSDLTPYFQHWMLLLFSTSYSFSLGHALNLLSRDFLDSHKQRHNAYAYLLASLKYQLIPNQDTPSLLLRPTPLHLLRLEYDFLNIQFDNHLGLDFSHPILQ